MKTNRKTDLGFLRDCIRGDRDTAYAEIGIRGGDDPNPEGWTPETVIEESDAKLALVDVIFGYFVESFGEDFEVKYMGPKERKVFAILVSPYRYHHDFKNEWLEVE